VPFLPPSLPPQIRLSDVAPHVCVSVDRFKWEQESSRFFEKRRGKKLLFGWACGGEISTARFKKSFFASFCSQKEAFLFA
jgi:hypothetical protein